MEYESHVAAGERLVRSVAGVSEAAGIVAAHEEQFDGGGYPAALSGHDILLEARIVAGAIAFSKLTRLVGPQRAAMAFARLAGTELDPEIVAATLALLAREQDPSSRSLRDVPAT
jgi:HD-GYP domain-containing protein (c-di-GMP phosphodiesterase class II)